jgi:hypothetical protein
MHGAVGQPHPGTSTITNQGQPQHSIPACLCAGFLVGQLHAQLLQVHNLLGKVSAMGPLVSLIKAHIVREEFLRTNRNLLDTFGILARGVQLLVGPLQPCFHAATALLTMPLTTAHSTCVQVL